jgi:hypothetical protein
MAMYTVTLRASKAQYPVLLSNGNLVESGDLEDGRHFAKWVDPHKKPSYLFAWWPASWWRASSRSRAVPATNTCCRSMCAPATWTRPSTP